MLETRASEQEIRRRRECIKCGSRWTSIERVKRYSLTAYQHTTGRGPPGTTGRGCETLGVGVSETLAAISGSGSSSSDLGSSGSSLQSDLRDSNVMGPKGAPVKLTPYWVVLGQFCEAWKARYGVNYQPTPADKNQLGRLVRSTPREMLGEYPAAFERYIADSSPFVAQEQRHSLAWFCTSGGFNKYRAAATVLSQREARNAEAVAQFVNGSRHAPR